MKKALLVSAILSTFTIPAYAESSVTLYGVVDAAYSYNNLSVKSTSANGRTIKTTTRELGVMSGIAEGSSYWGLRGSEDLGNGTSAIFTLENEFNPANGASVDSAVFNKFSYVGLTSDAWGTFTIGNQKSVADDFMPEADPFGTNFGVAGAPTTFGDSLSSQIQNSVKYMSPDFDGFQFGLGVAHSRKKTTQGSSTNKEGGTHLSLGLKYSTDKLFLGAAYDTTKAYADQSQRVHSFAVGASYDFDIAKVHAAYAHQRDGMFGAGIFGLDAFETVNDEEMATQWNAKGYKQNSWLVGFTVSVGDHGNVLFSYQGVDAKNPKIAAPVKTKGQVFSLGYTYDLSKRTSLYGLASYGIANTKFFNDAGQLTQKDKIKSTFVAVGLKHAF